MTKPILLLRLSYWAAAITDLVVAILFLMPERMGETEITYPMGLASVIVFSWVVILIMADRKPIERKWVLIPTIIVVALITIVRVTFSLGETIEFNLVLLIFAIALIILMTYSYFLCEKT
jgi:hypothetical protein